MVGFNDPAGFGKTNSPAQPKIGYKINKMPSNQASRHWKTLMSTGKTTTNTTYNSIMVAPCSSFNWVQVVLGNMEGSSVTIPQVIVAPTTSKTSRTVPTGGSLTNALTNDSTTGWSQVKFSGSNSVALASASSTAPSLAYSDWVQCRSQASTDGARAPYLLVRVLSPASGTFSGIFAGTGNTDATLATYMRGDSYSGDACTTPSNLAANTGEVSMGPIVGVNFRTSTPTIRIMAFGSSTTQGGGNPTPQDTADRSWVPMLEELLQAAGLPVTVENHGLSGATSAQYLAIAKARVSENAPTIAIYPPFSTNDGTPTQAIIDQMYSNALDFAENAMKVGTLPVFSFLCPNSAYDATADGFRLQLKARCQATPWLVLDMTTGISDTNTPQGFLPTYYYDGIHTNAAGYLVQAQTAYQPIVNLIMNNFSF